MYACPIEMKDVRYNPANQCFEASVTVHDYSTVRTYACAIEAPMSMSFANAAKGLTKQAIRRHQRKGGLFSEMERFIPRSRAARRSFVPGRWMRDLLNIPGREVA